jgi:DNA uptake protein ComE-like DNA-binding protein
MRKFYLPPIFQFSRKERTGIILLALLIVVTHYIPDLWPASEPAAEEDLQAAVKAFEQQLISDSIVTSARRDTYNRRPRWTTERSFPPMKKDTFRHARKPAIKPIDINTADTLLWQLLPGIGPGFARRIVRFREALGGFYSIQQVAECYGLPDSTFQKIQPFLKIGDSSLKILDLNLTDEKSLATHPYIRYKLARQIVQYRSMHAGFSKVSDLRQLPLVDDIIYRKLEYYITVKP